MGSTTPPAIRRGWLGGGDAGLRPTSAWSPANSLTFSTSTAQPAGRRYAALPPTTTSAWMGRWRRPGADGTTTSRQPAAATEPACSTTWTGVATAATWSPHPPDTPPTATTDGCARPPPPPHESLPRCAACSTPHERKPHNHDRPRRPGLHRLSAIPTARPPSPKNLPRSPTPPMAAATTPSTRPGSVSTAWSPAASSTTPTSKPAYSPPPRPAGCWPRSQTRPSAR